MANGPSPGSGPADPAPSGNRSQTILIVDDEPDIRDSLEMLFESALDGVEVRTAGSGADALALLEKERVDLVITDYKMPGMTGLELLARVGKAYPQVPRILVTAFPDLEIAIRAINEAGVENFFTKPFEPDQVLSVVRTLLYEQRAQDLRNKSFARSLDLLRRNLDKP